MNVGGVEATIGAFVISVVAIASFLYFYGSLNRSGGRVDSLTGDGSDSIMADIKEGENGGDLCSM